MGRSLVFLIDIEPDGRGVVHNRAWEGTRLAFPTLFELRDRWQQACGSAVHFNWFPRFDPQIEATFGRTAWFSQQCVGLAENIETHGDLAGVHIHFWRWHDIRRSWYNDFADPQWQRACIAQSIDGFREVFGAVPAAARFGDTWFSDTALELLCEAGVLYDLTLEPGFPARPLGDDPFATASMPETRAAPREPHRFTSPSGSLWRVPITVSDRDYWLPQRKFPFVQRAARSFNLALHPETVWMNFERELATETEAPIVFVVRSGDLAQRRYLRAFQTVTEQLARHAGLKECRFLRVDTAIERFARVKGEVTV